MSVVCSERYTCNVKKRVMAIQGQFKVVDFGTNRKCVCGFLLVFNSNLGRILHRFGDTAAYRSKNRKNHPFEPTPVSQVALARGDPLRIFRRAIPHQRVKSWGYMIDTQWRNHDASCFRFDTILAVTDRRTDRHVDAAKTCSTHSVARVKTWTSAKRKAVVTADIQEAIN